MGTISISLIYIYNNKIKTISSFPGTISRQFLFLLAYE